MSDPVIIIRISGGDSPSDRIKAGKVACQSLTGVTFSDPPAAWDGLDWCVFVEGTDVDAILAAVVAVDGFIVSVGGVVVSKSWHAPSSAAPPVVIIAPVTDASIIEATLVLTAQEPLKRVRRRAVPG